MEPPEVCPVCGALVPPEAAACPACGADEASGWSDRATAQRLGIPDDEFDYEEFVEDEFGGDRTPLVRTRGVSWWWWLVALGVVGAFLAMYLRV